MYQGGATGGGGTEGTVSPHFTKSIFVNRLKPMRKNWGVWGADGDVTNLI